MAETENVISQLVSLTKLDIDAIEAYASAIHRIDLPEVKSRLEEFRNDHVRHVSDLSALIERLGGTAPKRTPDMKGMFIQGMTAVRSLLGNESAIRAMKTNEELTNRKYDEALTAAFPDDARAVVERNRDDERRHLDYINRCIDERVWERAAA